MTQALKMRETDNPFRKIRIEGPEAEASSAETQQLETPYKFLVILSCLFSSLSVVLMRLLPVLLITVALTGCAKTSDLERVNGEQAQTIESLNKEISRLNAELEELSKSKDDLSRAKAELEKKLSGELESGDMSLSMQERGLVVTVLDRVLFDSGKADLKESSKDGLDKVAGILNGKVRRHMVYVEGHTDNVPIRKSSWRSNWELSTARATEVIHYFVDEASLDPKRIAATGYGEFHPVASNSTESGKSKNRRVEIVISPKKIGG